MGERHVTTTIDLSGCLGPLAVMVSVPALFMLALLAGQFAINSGWIAP